MVMEEALLCTTFKAAGGSSHGAAGLFTVRAEGTESTGQSFG
jgi:hypothetical protein